MKKLRKAVALLIVAVIFMSGFGLNVYADINTTIELKKYTGVNCPGVILGMSKDSSSFVSWKGKTIYVTNISSNKSIEIAVNAQAPDTNISTGWIYGFSNDCELFAVTRYGVIDVVNASTGKLVASIEGSAGSIVFTNDNTKLIAADGDSVTYYDIESEEISEVYSVSRYYPTYTIPMAVNPVSNEIAVGNGKLIQIRDINSWDLIASINADRNSHGIVYSNDGRYLLSSDGWVTEIFDAEDSFVSTITLNEGFENTLPNHISYYVSPPYYDKVLMGNKLYDLASSKPERYVMWYGSGSRCRFSYDYKYVYDEKGNIYFTDGLFINAADPDGTGNNGDNTETNDTNNNIGSANFFAITAATVVNNGVKVQWNAPSDTLKTYSYLLMRAELESPSDSIPVFDFPITATEYTDVNVLPNKAYAYYVISIDSSGERLYSDNTITITVGDAINYKITLQINNPLMYVNGVSKSIDEQGTVPIVYNGRTLLPIRSLIEALGGSVEWESGQSKVTINLGGIIVEMLIGNNTVYVNSIPKQMDVAPQIINNRTLLPLRFVVENLGMQAEWNGDNQTVIITK